MNNPAHVHIFRFSYTGRAAPNSTHQLQCVLDHQIINIQDGKLTCSKEPIRVSVHYWAFGFDNAEGRVRILHNITDRVNEDIGLFVKQES